MKSELSVVGIDLAKSIFHLVGMDERGKIIVNIPPTHLLLQKSRRCPAKAAIK
jgi:hypothetical protein